MFAADGAFIARVCVCVYLCVYPHLARPCACVYRYASCDAPLGYLVVSLARSWEPNFSTSSTFFSVFLDDASTSGVTLIFVSVFMPSFLLFHFWRTVRLVHSWNLLPSKVRRRAVVGGVGVRACKEFGIVPSSSASPVLESISRDAAGYYQE